MAYCAALELQRAHHAEVLAGRAQGVAHRVLLVEHPPMLAASIFHYGEHTVGEVKRALAAAGVEVRL